MADFEQIKGRLHHWYQANKRQLPWRETTDPYFIWLSEVILQQTRIDQGLAYFRRFTEHYPNVKLLANASEDEVLKLWQGLGYYSRARNLHQAAKTIAQQMNGNFPDTYNNIIALKGVGEYTAAAIASISFNLPHAVVDGNVFRVLARLFGIDTPIDSTAGKKLFGELAAELLDHHHPGLHNQAMMEFGALQCTPKNPNCTNCILNDCCIALQESKIDKLPVKQGKIKIRHRYFNYIVLTDDRHSYLQKRTGNDIWKNLFEFPLVEAGEKTEIDQVLKQLDQLGIPTESQILSVSNWQKQVLSHQHIHYRFIQLEQTSPKTDRSNLIRVDQKDIFKFAVPKPIEQKLAQLEWI
ncbi:A/G-specific adenine glycosylase [Mangrovibacterium marinum]|uniref:Adenine DNA glycosylase n=1 Tax=Mangrovibacterium marinum TaxID=1639118 RepID=A0A2T5C4V5_9BACT|nr:A/G-specific adenine glycosylase [Mangrovibacterium marinum]PTN09877.1 A/G-specific DNA-adenine glycosylase [Mangrovibacterium marinum]